MGRPQFTSPVESPEDQAAYNGEVFSLGATVTLTANSTTASTIWTNNDPDNKYLLAVYISFPGGAPVDGVESHVWVKENASQKYSAAFTNGEGRVTLPSTPVPPNGNGSVELSGKNTTGSAVDVRVTTVYRGETR